MPIKLKEFEVKQSKFDVAPKFPFRFVILGPSRSGKTILLQNMILNIYKNCFSRNYIFSPSIEVDMIWTPVKHYIEHEMKIAHTEKEPPFFDTYGASALQNIIDTQQKVIDYMKKQKGVVKLYSVLVVVDDFADDPTFSRQSKMLHAL